MPTAPTNCSSLMHNMEYNQAANKTKRVDSYLITPPDHLLDSFSQGRDEALEMKGWQEAIRNTLPPIQGQTPPTSPADKLLPSISAATGLSHDAPLFPESEAQSRLRSQSPLFRSSSPQPRYRDGQTAASSRASPPVSPWSGVRTPKEARQYYNDRMDELRHLRSIQLPLPLKSAASSNLDKESSRQLHSLSKSSAASKVVKLRVVPKHATRPRPAAAAPSVVTSNTKTAAPKRRTPKVRTYDEFVDTASPLAQQHNKHKRAPPTKKVENTKVSWTELPNYAPPTTTLDSAHVKPLRASWPGSALNLANDPDRAHLHPQELALASTLRLTCASYLTNKRKVFQARLKSLQDGKSFTKTAAQTACSIDVNKASGLWEAFERVGWFEAGWFEKFL